MTKEKKLKAFFYFLRQIIEIRKRSKIENKKRKIKKIAFRKWFNNTKKSMFNDDDDEDERWKMMMKDDDDDDDDDDDGAS